MNRAAFLSLVLGAALLAPAQEKNTAPKPRPGRDLLSFKNGDALHGSLAKIDAESGVEWARPDAKSPFHFEASALAEVQLGGLPAQTPWTNNCIIQLANGDQIGGRLLGYDGEAVRLDTWYGGELSIPKTVVGLILPLPPPKPALFEGPGDAEGWTVGKVSAAAVTDSGQWHFHKGAIYASKSASIARDLKLPDMASLQFDLDWRGFFHVAIALYTEYLHPISLANKETEPKFGGFYSLQINPFAANLLPVKQMDPLRFLGQAPLQMLAQKSSAKFDIRINRAKRTISLLVDGALVKQWTDTDEFAGTGTAIRFVHQGQGAVKMSNLRVFEWDGQFEEPVSVTPNKTVDVARLRNGDRISGPVKQIKPERLSVLAAETLLEIPLSRVKQIELAADAPPPAKATGRTVRGYFASGGMLTFDLDRWTAEGILGQAAGLGKLQLSPNSFSRILFDPGQPPASEPN